MNHLHPVLTIAVASAVTIALRFLPFLIFRENRQTPKLIVYLGQVLPFAIMGMLVVYCLKNLSFASAGSWLPQLIGCVIVAALHIWQRNTLLSIGAGTVCYMLMVQFLF